MEQEVEQKYQVEIDWTQEEHPAHLNHLQVTREGARQHDRPQSESSESS